VGGKGTTMGRGWATVAAEGETLGGSPPTSPPSRCSVNGVSVFGNLLFGHSHSYLDRNMTND
jgi:hypothetical protein